MTIINLRKNTFSKLCKGLYEPLLERQGEALHSSIEKIINKYASRGFSIPPGIMYAEIWKNYKADMPIRAEIIFNCCCQSYSANTQKPSLEEFSHELLEAISKEKDRILASGVARFNQFNTQFTIPSYQALLEQYKSEISSEGRRLLRFYSSKAIVFLGESTAEVVPSDTANNNAHHWYQGPIGIIGLTVIGGILVTLAVYLIKLKLGIAL